MTRRRKSRKSSSSSERRDPFRGMRQNDFHGWTVEEAEKFFFELLNEIRIAGRSQSILCITGTGKIQRRLAALAAAQDLHAYVPMANPGCIIIEFE